jgi:hypothetical protein
VISLDLRVTLECYVCLRLCVGIYPTLALVTTAAFSYVYRKDRVV